MDVQRVFISYSWSDQDHQARVLALAERLRHDGVDVVLDKWDLKHGQDTVSFMEQMVTDPSVSKVLVLIDRPYSEKADSRKGGVGTESQIISKEVYDRVDQIKFLPIVFDKDDDGRAVLPTFFKSRFYLDFSTPERAEDQYPVLLRAIFDKPLHPKPALGKPPSYLLAAEKDVPRFRLPVDAIRTLIENGRPSTDAKIDESLQMFVEHLGGFELKLPPHDRPLDDTLMDQLSNMVEARDTFLALVAMLARYRPTDTIAERLHETFAQIFRLSLPPKRPGPWADAWADHYRFFLHELFLSTITVLLNARCSPILLPLLAHDYYVERDQGNNAFVSFSRFRCTADSFEQRNRRLKLNLVSLVAETVKQRCTGKMFAFEDIVQAEFVLFLRSFLVADRAWDIWYPATIAYARERRLPIFVKAESKRYAAFLFEALGVVDREDLLARYATANQRSGLNDQLNVNYWPIQISRVANLEKLATRP